MGDVGGAAAILDAVIATGRATGNRAAPYLAVQEVRTRRRRIRVADTLVILRLAASFVRTSEPTNPFEARKILAERGAFKEEREIVGAALTVIGTYCDERNFDDAMLEAEELKRAYESIRKDLSPFTA